MKRTRVITWAAAVVGLLLASRFGGRSAQAEVVLVQKDGWEVYTDGRVGAFASEAFGKAIPEPADPTRQLLVGSFGSYTDQWDTSRNVLAFRLRSGLLPNILGFGFRKELTETTTLRGYIAFWASVDTSRTKYHKSDVDVRQGYLQVEGPWGSLLAGRALALFSRGNYEIDVLYQHGFGVGHPCYIDTYGSERGFTGGGGCGHVGYGILHPSYDAGFVYATPSLGGLKFSVGIYDPVELPPTMRRTSFPRPEAELAFEHKLGDLGLIKVFASGIWQRLQGKITDPADPTAMAQLLIDRDAYGAAGGARLELGPLRLGASGYYGKGLGTHFALQTVAQGSAPIVFHDFSSAGATGATFNLRKFDGLHAAIAGVFGKFSINAGYGMARIHQLTEDSNVTLTPQSTPKWQFGISGGITFRIHESLIYNLDYFRAQSEWYGGEKQTMNFVSTGLVTVW